jgi:hypothetical protein
MQFENVEPVIIGKMLVSDNGVCLEQGCENNHTLLRLKPNSKLKPKPTNKVLNIMEVILADGTSDIAVWSFIDGQIFAVGRQLVISPFTFMVMGNDCTLSMFCLDTELSSPDDIVTIVDFADVKSMVTFEWHDGYTKHESLNKYSSTLNKINNVLKTNYDKIMNDKPDTDVLKEIHNYKKSGGEIHGLCKNIVELFEAMDVSSYMDGTYKTKYIRDDIKADECPPINEDYVDDVE